MECGSNDEHKMVEENRSTLAAGHTAVHLSSSFNSIPPPLFWATKGKREGGQVVETFAFDLFSW
jgi:hypothetical protein